MIHRGPSKSAPVKSATANQTNFKCVVIGDDFIINVGSKGYAKVGLIIKAMSPAVDLSFYFPSVADNCGKEIQLNDRQYVLGLWDTTGSDGNIAMGSYSLVNTDVFIVLFSVKQTSTMESIPERCARIRDTYPHAKFMLVGITDHAVNETETLEKRVVSPEAAFELATKIRAMDYQECSINQPAQINKMLTIMLGHLLGYRIEKKPAFFKRHTINPVEVPKRAKEAIEVAKGRRQRHSNLSLLPEDLVKWILLDMTKGLFSSTNALKVVNFILSSIPREGGLYNVDSHGKSSPGLHLFRYARLIEDEQNSNANPSSKVQNSNVKRSSSKKSKQTQESHHRKACIIS